LTNNLDNAEGIMSTVTIERPPVTSDLGRPPWAYLKRRKILGTSTWIELEAGQYWDEGRQYGTYYSARGDAILCNAAKASDMAQLEGVPFRHIMAGEHTGAVWCVNYLY